MAFRNRTPISMPPPHPMKGEEENTYWNQPPVNRKMTMVASTQCDVNATYDAMVNIKPNRPILHWSSLQETQECNKWKDSYNESEIDISPQKICQRVRRFIPQVHLFFLLDCDTAPDSQPTPLVAVPVMHSPALLLLPVLAPHSSAYRGTGSFHPLQQ